MMSAMGFLTRFLSAEVSAENFRKLLSFFNNRISRRPIKIKVESNGKVLDIEAANLEELEIAIEVAQRFLEKLDEEE